MRSVSPRVLLWLVVLVVAAILIVRYRQSGPKAAQTLVAAAIPTATAYAHDVVSAQRCGDARSLAHSGIGDPCKTFAGIQGERIVGAGRIVRGCTGVSGKIPNVSAGDDCVRFRLAGPQGRGVLHVWLEQHENSWRVASAASELHA